MALLKSLDDTCDYRGLPQMPSIELFEQAKRRLKSKKEAIEDLQNEYKLLEKQAFELYKSHVRYEFYFSKHCIEMASKWLNMLSTCKDSDGNKLDKRKKYEEKTYYAYLVDTIKEKLGIDDFVFEKIAWYGWEKLVAIISFKSNDHEWDLHIPIIENINLKTYQQDRENIFKLRLCFRGNYRDIITTSTVGITFEEDELKDIMQKGIEKYCKENK